MSINYTNENTIIFTLARMNPPTPGHLFLIRVLILEAIKKNVNDVYVILSKTNNNNENPIPCPEKIQVLGEPDNTTSKTMINVEKQKMIEETEDSALREKISGIKINVLCVPDVPRATPFTPLISLVTIDKERVPDLNLILVIGEDRAEMLDSITGFFFKLDNVKMIDGIILPREEMTTYKEYVKDCGKLAELNIENVPTNALSASFVRGIVRCNNREKFNQLYAPYLDEEITNNLYESVHRGLSLPNNDKKDAPPKPLKYRYPMIKNVSEIGMDNPQTKKPKTKKGGRLYKRKTRKNKLRKYIRRYVK